MLKVVHQPYVSKPQCRSVDLKLLDKLVYGIDALSQVGELLACSHLPVWICEYEVNFSLELVHCHWCLRGAEDLLDLMSHPCPSSSALHV